MAWDWRESFLDLILGVAYRGCVMRNGLRARAVLPKPRVANRIAMQSGVRVLDGRFVPGAKGMPVVLLCHGIGDTLDLWDGAQAVFEAHGIGSLVFSYSGYGKSTGRIRVRHYEEDFATAYGEMLRCVGPETPIFVLGYSLGTGIAAKGVLGLKNASAGLFLCSGFTTFREAGLAIGAPRWLARCVPDVWHTRDALSGIAAPVVVVHSDEDELFPMEMAEGLAATRGLEVIALRGISHSDPFFQVAEGYWAPIAERMLAMREAR